MFFCSSSSYGERREERKKWRRENERGERKDLGRMREKVFQIKVREDVGLEERREIEKLAMELARMKSDRVSEEGWRRYKRLCFRWEMWR